MTQNKDVRARIGYTVDTGSVEQAASANRRVADSYANVDAVVKALGADIVRLNPQLAQQTSQATQGAAVNNRLADSYRRVKEEAANARAQISIGGENFRTGFGTIRSLSGAAGLLAGSSQAGSAVAAFAGLTAELGAFGAVAAGASLAVKVFSDITARGVEQTKNATDAQKAYFEAVETGSKESIQTARDNAEIALKVSQDLQRYYQQVLSQAGVDINQQLGLLAAPVKIAEALGLPGSTGITKGYVDALAAANDAVTQNTALLNAYDRALQSTSVSLNTTTEAQLEAAERAVEIDQMTREERTERQRQLVREIELLGALANQAGVGTDTYDELRVQIDELLTEVTQLSYVTDTYADQLEAEKDAKQALIDQSDAIQKGIEEQQKAEEALRDATEAVTEAQADLTEALREHRANQRQIILDMYAAEAKALADRQEDERDAREKANEALVEQEVQHQRRVQEIHARFALDERAAIGQRDALALYNAKLRRDEALKQEAVNNDDRKKAIQKSLDDQLKVIQKRYDDQLKTIKEAASKAIAAENERYRKQQQNLEAALNKALAAEQFANNRLEALRSENAFRAQYWAGVVETADKRLADAHAALAVSVTQSALLVEQVNSQVRGGGGSGGGGGGGIGAFMVGTGGLGAPVGAGYIGGSLNIAAPRTGAGTFPGAGRGALPSVYGGNTRSTVIHFAPVINGARMTAREFERMSDRWFDHLWRGR